MNVRKVKKYGAEQLEHIRNAVDLDPAIFEKFVQLTRNEEETLEGERGTLALEKEGKPRPVDAFHYAMYRRAAVDQNGAFPARGIILPLYYLFVGEDDTRPEEEDESARKKADTLLEQITILQEKRAADYCEEMKADPAAILEDLTGYISKMSKKIFPWISQAGTAPPEPADYTEAYLNVWGVIIDGAAALRLIEADTEENRDTLHAAIDKAARKLSGQLPPEEGAPRFDFPKKIGGADNPFFQAARNELPGQQMLNECCLPATLKIGFELSSRNPLADVFRRGGISKKDFDNTYSPAQYKGDKFMAAIEEVEQLKSSLSDRADKLLTSIGAAYISRHPSDNVVYIDFLDYCDKCGYNTGSNDLIRKAKQRIKDDMRDIERLKFTVKRAKGDYITLHLIGSNGIFSPKKGDPYIMCAIDPAYAHMINQGQLVNYRRSIYQYTGTPYNVIKKLTEHNFMDSNVLKSTNDILNVKTLIAASGLQETEWTLKHWRSELKERLEDALERLHEGGDLKEWEYCKAKKERLTDAEKDNIVNNTYAAYTGLYIRFVLEDTPDDGDRRAKKTQKEIENAPKKPRKATKKGKSAKV